MAARVIAFFIAVVLAAELESNTSAVEGMRTDGPGISVSTDARPQQRNRQKASERVREFYCLLPVTEAVLFSS